MKWVKMSAGLVMALGLVFGFKFYQKFLTANQVKHKLLAACAEDSQCATAVNQNFDGCFDANYSLGSRRRLGHLDAPKFADCLEQKVGESFTLRLEES